MKFATFVSTLCLCYNLPILLQDCADVARTVVGGDPCQGVVVVIVAVAVVVVVIVVVAVEVTVVGGDPCQGNRRLSGVTLAGHAPFHHFLLQHLWFSNVYGFYKSFVLIYVCLCYIYCAYNLFQSIMMIGTHLLLRSCVALSFKVCDSSGIFCPLNWPKIGQQTFCQDGHFVRNTFCQDQLREAIKNRCFPLSFLSTMIFR